MYCCRKMNVFVVQFTHVSDNTPKPLPTGLCLRRVKEPRSARRPPLGLADAEPVGPYTKYILGRNGWGCISFQKNMKWEELGRGGPQPFLHWEWEQVRARIPGEFPSIPWFQQSSSKIPPRCWKKTRSSGMYMYCILQVFMVHIK
jgi:hypothetical protein